MRNLPDLYVRRGRAWVIALVALFIGLGAIGGIGQYERTASATDSLVAGADSTTVLELQERLPEGDDSAAVVLYTADQGSLTEPIVGTLQKDFTARIEEAGQPPTDGPPALVVSEDGTAAIGILPVAADGNAENRDAVAALRADLRAQAPDGVSVQVTGPAAIQADLGAVFDGANTRLLLATASVVALLLLITYRSPILWVVPLVVVGIADQLASVVATRILGALGLAWDESTVGILSVLVFGAGTNYALLLISRYRDELRTTPDRYAAMARAVREAGEAILLSATTVVLGLGSLALSLVPSTRGLGIACSIGILVAVGYALVVLPTVLVLFGRWVFWPLVPREGQTLLVDSERSVWHMIGQLVSRRPSAFIAICVVVLAAMAGGLTQVNTGLSKSDQFLDKPEAIAASERLAESFPAGSSDPTVIVTSQDGDALAATAEGVDGVSSATVTKTGDGLSQVDVVLQADPGSDSAADGVRALRSALESTPDTFVGGSEAEAIDSADGAVRDRLLIIPIVLAVVLGVLMLLLRSVVAPVILVTTVVGTYLAALGASWWIFTGVLGFGALDVSVPLLAFLFLVALGVDYNIFLVIRAREEAAAYGAEQGMLRALSATGGVITSAGILLAAVFAVLGVLPLVVLAQLGVVICLGVLLDTLLVRTVLVPALGLVLGERFWWPRTVGPRASDDGADDAGSVEGGPAGEALGGRDPEPSGEPLLTPQ